MVSAPSSFTKVISNVKLRTLISLTSNATGIMVASLTIVAPGLEEASKLAVSSPITSISLAASDRLSEFFSSCATSDCVSSFAEPGTGILGFLVSSAGGFCGVVSSFGSGILLSSFFGTFVALSLVNYYQKYIDPVRAAILYALEPVWATIFAVGTGVTIFNYWLLIGGSCLLVGNLIAEIGNQRVSE